jgi:hypothetical protein
MDGIEPFGFIIDSQPCHRMANPGAIVSRVLFTVEMHWASLIHLDLILTELEILIYIFTDRKYLIRCGYVGS